MNKKLTHALDIDNKKIVYDGCMVTFTGEIINLLKPHENNYLIEDIAHGLAMTCRWNGATKTYFSVAEHCCMMFDQVPLNKKATALFHDSEEAYWGDIIKPLKNILPKEVRQAMTETRHAIFRKFGVADIDEVVDQKDFELLQWDLDNLILSRNHLGWSPEKAEREWLRRYNLLTPQTTKNER